MTREQEALNTIENEYSYENRVFYLPQLKILSEAIKPKNYLKWEDLEFTYEEQTIKVKMGERKYTLIYHKWFMLNKWYYHAELRNEETLEIIHNIRGGIFNDLHLERVE